MHKKNTFNNLLFGISTFFVSFSTGFSAEIIEVESVGSGSSTVLGSTVIPYKEVTLAAQMPGRVEFLSGDVGAKFKQGDLLTKIDDDDLQAKRRSILAMMDSANANLKNSQAQYQRELVSPRSKDISGMPGMGMPAMMDVFMTRPFYNQFGDYNTDYNRYSDLLNSQTGVSQAKSQVMQAMSQLGEIDARLKDSVSVAPFEGMILKKMVEVGDTVQPGQPLFKYGFVKYLRLQADVPSILRNQLKVGMVVPVTINGNLRTDAKVSQIYPIADAQRHTVTVKFDLYTNVKASPGMYAEIQIPDVSGSGNVVAIPRSALLEGKSLPSVLVVNDQGVSELRLVRLGSNLGGTKNMVAVMTGLKAGDKIIDNPPAGKSSGYMPGQNK
ncbi:MAG: RND family efflux transporter, MFP subunit [uncultured Thiotrichaceae bacterium]|uniref:RND family efflux transporter, MFP subunit n=1 Tax=uncultured Thiotrichaceae bacterium TaxID=298394 RepID=A0A6S6SI19_9GAMM|nr:MAG: RND family efflux transporter, MFP subunit [uncultured Thiotrichaceae bacterium]